MGIVDEQKSGVVYLRIHPSTTASYSCVLVTTSIISSSSSAEFKISQEKISDKSPFNGWKLPQTREECHTLCPADWPETSSGVELILRLIAITKVTGKQRHGESSLAVIVELI